MAPDLVRVVVADVAVAVPAGMGVEAGQVTLAELDAPYRRISMFIGQPEARAIRTAWRNEVPPRPTTWDLFVSTVSLLGGRVERAVIDDVEEARHFFAQISLRRHDGERLVITARPSDAIALALRSDGARILCRSEVL
ncbi:MAG TPA: bifunctional nuclease family protein, partial [Acidimicrobiales bacterium]|nr:bifunctional nuclease family protein [Acidimicrobiales bacterium]